MMPIAMTPIFRVVFSTPQEYSPVTYWTPEKQECVDYKNSLHGSSDYVIEESTFTPVLTKIRNV